RVRRPAAGLPTTNDISLVTAPGVAKPFTLMGNDLMGRALILNLLNSPSNGSITGNNPNLIYTPRSGFTGADVFTYRAVVSNSTVAGEASTVYVIVR
ncbi:MAG: Ig-like domain-containing protein, partial [Acidobacteria bacterium]|nr:Ig-like domain-containing protein [Acidobacteriota bacterium]